MAVLPQFVCILLWRLNSLRASILFLLVVCLLYTNAISEAIFFLMTSPEKLNYIYQIYPAYQIGSRFPPYTMKDVGLVYADPPDACDPLENADHVNGEAVLIERGECTFAEKVTNAERAGAIMAIITDSSADTDEFVDMIRDDTGRTAGIPAAYLPGSSGRRIRQYLMYEKSMAFIEVPINFTTRPIDPEYDRPPWELW